MRMRSSLICLKSPNVSILLDLIQFRRNSSQQSFHTQWKAPLCLHEDRRCSHTEEDAITMQRKDKLGWRRKWRASPDFHSNSIDRINFLLTSKVSPARVPSRVETAGGKSLCSSSWVKTLRLLFPDTSATHVIGGLLVTSADVLLVLLTISWYTQEHITNAPSVAKGEGGIGGGLLERMFGLVWELAAYRRAPLSAGFLLLRQRNGRAFLNIIRWRTEPFWFFSSSKMDKFKEQHQSEKLQKSKQGMKTKKHKGDLERRNIHHMEQRAVGGCSLGHCDSSVLSSPPLKGLMAFVYGPLCCRVRRLYW